MKKLLFFLSLLFFCGVFAYADVPKKLNVQGKLTSDSGQVLAGKTITSAFLHLGPVGTTSGDHVVNTQTGATDSNGLYNLNFDVANFDFSNGAAFKIVLTVFEVGTIETVWADIATNPYSFYSSTAAYSNYSSTATYAKILDPTQTEKLVDGNFNPAVTYNINVSTAVAVSTDSYTIGNAYVWGIGTDGVQKWTNPDIQVSTAAYAINAGTATYSNASSYAINATTAAYVLGSGLPDGSVTTLKIADANVTPAKLTQGDYINVYQIKVDTATYALNATTATYVLGSGLPDGSITTLKIADANVTPAKLTQGDYINVYQIKVDTATYAINAGTATYSNASSYALNAATAAYVSGSGLPDGSVTTSKIADTNVTPAKLQQGGGVLYNILVSSANNASNASEITASGAGANLFWGYDSSGTNQLWRTVVVSSSNVSGLSGAAVANATNAASATIAVTAVTASSMTAVGGANSFWGYDNGGASQGWRNLAAGNGIDISGYTVSVATGAGLGFSGSSLVVTTAPYATGAGTATTVVNGAITSAKIALDAVTSMRIANGAVVEDKIGSFAVTETKISTGAVTAVKIGTGAVIEEKIGTGAVTETKIANGSIIPEHFKYVGTAYAYTYDIKVATAVYAETPGADLAEIYASTELLTPGDVVSIDITKDNSIVKTKVAEDTLVAGVISTKPGLLMNKTEKGYELALVGKVPTKVCNEGGSIKRGDLLVSASMAGYAKKAGDNPKTGTVIGKALENFDSVTGTILVLVNLQ